MLKSTDDEECVLKVTLTHKQVNYEKQLHWKLLIFLLVCIIISYILYVCKIL